MDTNRNGMLLFQIQVSIRVQNVPDSSRMQWNLFWCKEFSLIFWNSWSGCCSCFCRVLTKSWFPLSRNFYVCTHVNFVWAHKKNTIYGRSRVNVKVEPRSTFMFTRGLSYIASISFTHVNFTCVRTEKLGNKINPKLQNRGNYKDQHSI